MMLTFMINTISVASCVCYYLSLSAYNLLMAAENKEHQQKGATSLLLGVGNILIQPFSFLE